MIAFETGRIRPPSEAQSILLRITRSCHWNRCAFCPVYKHEQYSIRKVDEIKRDIDAMAAVADRIRRRMDGACGAGADRAKVVDAAKGLDRDDAVDADCARLMAFWMFHGLRSVFLQDADALVLRTGAVGRDPESPASCLSHRHADHLLFPSQDPQSQVARRA